MKTSLAQREQARLKERIGDFKWDETEAKRWLTRNFGRDLKQFELQQIADKFLELIKADNLQLYKQIAMDREDKRRKIVLQKWYDLHFHIVKPYLERIIVQDSEGNLFGPAKEQAMKALEALCK